LVANFRETDMALTIAASVRFAPALLPIGAHILQGRVKPQVKVYPFKEWLTALDLLVRLRFLLFLGLTGL
jgi:hypothetical protein